MFGNMSIIKIVVVIKYNLMFCVKIHNYHSYFCFKS